VCCFTHKLEHNNIQNSTIINSAGAVAVTHNITVSVTSENVNQQHDNCSDRHDCKNVNTKLTSSVRIIL